MCRNQNFEILRLFNCWFFSLSFFSFSFLFAAVVDLLLGLLVVKKTSKEVSSRRPILTMEQPGVVEGNFAPSFSLIVFSIFVHISGSGHHCKDLFLLQRLSVDDANFGQKWWRQKWKKGQSSSRPVTAGAGVNGTDQGDQVSVRRGWTACKCYHRQILKQQGWKKT